MKFVFDYTAFDAYVAQRNGPVAGELERHADRAVDLSKATVSEKYDDRWVKGRNPPWRLNPPPGPPLYRSGGLHDSIRKTPPQPDAEYIIQVQIVADPAVENFAFSTNNKNGRAIDGVQYLMIDVNELVA